MKLTEYEVRALLNAIETQQALVGVGSAQPFYAKALESAQTKLRAALRDQTRMERAA